MRRAYTVAQIRAAEEKAAAALPEGVLMARAAQGLAARCARLLGGTYGRRVVVLAGSGNNGGDALYAAAELARRGSRVEALLLGERHHARGLAALRAAGGRTRLVGGAARTGALPGQDRAVADLLADADLVLDGILGIGGRGGLRDAAAALAAAVHAGGGLVVAVDLPSGVEADTGEVPGAAIAADLTVTFGAEKPGLLSGPGAALAGVVEVVDIGLDLPVSSEIEALQDPDVAARLPQLEDESTKYRRGVLGLVAGSDTYPGAAVLATGGALRTGVGMVRYAGPPQAAGLVRSAWPEVIVTEAAGGDVTGIGRVQAWAVGPGLGIGEDARAAVAAVLATDLPVILDADALTVLATDPALVAGRAAPTILTPHAGELSRLVGTPREELEARPLPAAREAAARLGVLVLLKGSRSVLARPDGRVRVNVTGTPLLATAGSGDVLTGAMGALLAAGLDAFDAGSVAAYLHGRAARMAHAGSPVIAGDVLAALPQAIHALTETGAS